MTVSVVAAYAPSYRARHGSLAAANRCQQTVAVGRRDFGVAAFQKCFACDVADFSVGVRGDDSQLLFGSDCLHDGVLRDDFQSRDSRRVQVQLDAVGDPAADEFVIRLARLNDHAADVRHGAGGLQQHQAVIRRCQVDAAR